MAERDWRVIAVLRSGLEIELAPEMGSTPEAVIARLTSNSLTGSAVPMPDAELESALGGSRIRYGEVASFKLDTRSARKEGAGENG